MFVNTFGIYEIRAAINLFSVSFLASSFLGLIGVCGTKVFYKSAPQECSTRLSYKSVLQECPARVSHKSFLLSRQEIPKQCVLRSVRSRGVEAQGLEV